MKSITSILKAALEAKNAAQAKKTRSKKNKNTSVSVPASSTEIITPKKTKRSTRGG